MKRYQVTMEMDFPNDWDLKKIEMQVRWLISRFRFLFKYRRIVPKEIKLVSIK